MDDELEQFIINLHHTCKIINRGLATVMGNTVDAIEVKNLYNQHIVWGMFSTHREKFKGKLANNANTDDVEYIPLV